MCVFIAFSPSAPFSSNFVAGFFSLCSFQMLPTLYHLHCRNDSAQCKLAATILPPTVEDAVPQPQLAGVRDLGRVIPQDYRKRVLAHMGLYKPRADSSKVSGLRRLCCAPCSLLTLDSDLDSQPQPLTLVPDLGFWLWLSSLDPGFRLGFSTPDSASWP